MVYSALKSRAGDVWYRLVGVMELECHFCCNKFKVSYADRNCWTCPECEQYNGFTEDGDYNRDLDLTSGPVTRFATNQNTSDQTPGNGLCHQCNLNQEVKMRSLNGFKCSNIDAKYKDEMTVEELEEVRRYDDSREYLDRTYRLCPECDDKVNSYISDQDRSLAGQLNEFRAGKIRNKLKVTGQKCRKSLIKSTYYPLVVSVIMTAMLIVPEIKIGEIVPQHILYNVKNFWTNSTHTEVLRSQLQSMFPHICPDEAIGELLSSLYIPVVTAMLLLSIMFSTKEIIQTKSKSAAINAIINAIILGTVTLSSRLNLHQLMILCCVSVLTSVVMSRVSKPGLKKSPKTKKDFRSLLTPPPLLLNHRVEDKDSDKDEVRTQDLLSLSDFTTSSPVPSFQTAPVIPHNSFVPIGSPVLGANTERPPISPAAIVRSGLLRSSDEFSFTHEFATNVRPGASRECDLASLSLDDDLSPSPAPTAASITSEPPFSLREYSLIEDGMFKPKRKIIQPARFQPHRPTTNSWVAGGYWQQPAQSHNLSFPLSRSSSQSSGFISGTASRTFGDFHTPAMSVASTHTVTTSPPTLRRRNVEDSISDSSYPRDLGSSGKKMQGENETSKRSVLDYSVSVSLRNILLTLGSLGFVVSVGTNVYYYYSLK